MHISACFNVPSAADLGAARRAHVHMARRRRTSQPLPRAGLASRHRLHPRADEAVNR